MPLTRVCISCGHSTYSGFGPSVYCDRCDHTETNCQCTPIQQPIDFCRCGRMTNEDGCCNRCNYAIWLCICHAIVCRLCQGSATANYSDRYPNYTNDYIPACNNCGELEPECTCHPAFNYSVLDKQMVCQIRHRDVYQWECSRCGWESSADPAYCTSEDCQYQIRACNNVFHASYDCGGICTGCDNHADGCHCGDPEYCSNCEESPCECAGPEQINILNNYPEPHNPAEEVTIHMAANCRCESCKIAKFGLTSSKLKSAFIESYSYTPIWKLFTAPNDPDNYFLGVELETDQYRRDTSGREINSGVDVSVAADMALPKSLWFAKSDSSVSGPEFVSHPATFAYWNKNKKYVSQMLKMLVHAGYRSHDNNRCGMHINISRTAFESATHLFRFLTILHADPEWSLKMSQRTRSSAGQWAKLDSCIDSYDRKQISNKMMGTGYDEGYTDDRYVALNAPMGEKRFEFRLPRGTLRTDRFYKNLEWTVAMIEFAEETRVKECNPNTFMEFVSENNTIYPNLLSFIQERIIQ